MLMKVLVLIFALHISCSAAQCLPETCCAPGTPQAWDSPDTDEGSFCTHKPFEDGYSMNIGVLQPIQVNLVDYCTDTILFSTFFAVEMDKFSLINVPCAYQPVACNLVPQDQYSTCMKGQGLWSSVFKCPATSNSTTSNQNKTFYQKQIASRICSDANYCTKSSSSKKTCDKSSALYYVPPTAPEKTSNLEESVGYCTCNNNITNSTTGVPDGFIKAGMSTFYVQVMIGGRATSDASDDTTCSCSGPQDYSAACMCMLGTKKVPYIYNNSIVPYYTALISVTNGLLIYKNNYIKFNFESNGVGCVPCSIDYCWGIPNVPQCASSKCTETELLRWNWKYMGLNLNVQSPLSCAIPFKPPAGVSDFKDPAKYSGAYCTFPSSAGGLDLCSLKIYVAWVGTDGYGHSCQSNNEMFSKFTQMGVAGFLQGVGSGISGLAADLSSGVSSE